MSECSQCENSERMSLYTPLGLELTKSAVLSISDTISLSLKRKRFFADKSIGLHRVAPDRSPG